MNSPSSRALGALLLAFAALGSGSHAQCLPVEELTLPGASGNYGTSVALSGDVAAVGAPLADGIGANKEGGVEIWRHDGVHWTHEQTVLAADGELFDYFGNSVALGDGLLAVGAPYDDDQGAESGAVYLYRFGGGTWNQERKLVAPGGGARTQFGWRLALDGDVLFAEASGEVFVYRYHGAIIGWQFEQSISVSSFDAEFDVSGDRAVFGEYQADGATTGDGAVVVYEFDGAIWAETARLSGSSADTGDQFGRSVAIDGERIAAGATLDGGTGSLYVLEYDGLDWVEQARLLPGNGIGGEFGAHVALDGVSAVVLSRTEDFAYEFRQERGLWVESAMFGSPITDIGFAASVAIDGDRALIGSSSNHAYEYPAATLRLTIDPLAPNPGDPISIRTHAGIPDKPVLLYVVSINGQTFFLQLAIFQFGDDYAFTIEHTVPPGLGGLDVGFLSFGVGATGKVLASNTVEVSFQ